MIITCEACSTSFRLKASLLKKTGSMVRCSKCRHTFIAYPPPEEPLEFISDEGRESGPGNELAAADVFSKEVGADLDHSLSEELSDLEAEIDAHVSDLSKEVSEELFEETEVSFEELGADSRESEIMIDDLEADASEVVSLEGLAADSQAASEVDFDEITTEPYEEPEEMISLADMEQEEAAEEVAFDELEGEAEAAEETEALAEFEIEEEEAAEEIAFDTLEDETGAEEETEILEDAEIEAEIEEAIIEDAEADEGLEFEMEEGVVSELKKSDVDKEPEGPSKKAKKETAETQPDKKAREPEAEEEFELDLESELGEADFEKEAVLKGEAGLDLDEFVEMNLEEEPSGKTEDLDLDFKAEDLDFKTEDFELDLEGETTEAEGLDLDLEAKTEEVKTEDFELDLEGETTEAEGLDLDLEAKTEEVGTEEFELDLEEEPTEELTTAESEETVEAVADKVKTEELDLSDIEDFLDFEEAPETVKPESEVEAEEAAETETLDVDLDFETVTAPEEDIDLETILEEETIEAGEDKEVALETFGEREKRIEAEYKKTAEPVMEEVPEEAPEAVEPERAAFEEIPSMRMEEERPRFKVLWIALAILIVLGALIFAATYFGAKEQAPIPPPDQGNLQIEMIANPAYRFVESEKAGEMLVITGDVTNRYDHPRGEIQVKGTLYDQTGEAIGVSTAYCGNTLTDSDLASLELETIKTHLANRKGDKDAAKPGQTLPFTVVFAPVPQDAQEFDVAVVMSSKK